MSAGNFPAVWRSSRKMRSAAGRTGREMNDHGRRGGRSAEAGRGFPADLQKS